MGFRLKITSSEREEASGRRNRSGSFVSVRSNDDYSTARSARALPG